MCLNFCKSWRPSAKAPNLPRDLRITLQWLPQNRDLAPDVEVGTTLGPLRFHDCVEAIWSYLYSHRAAHTRLCTSKLVSLAIEDVDFTEIGVKLVGLTGSFLGEQRLWHRDIESPNNASVDFPCAEDEGGTLVEVFGMYHIREAGGLPIRKSCIVTPGLRIAMIFEYPVHVGRKPEKIFRVCEALILRAQTGGVAAGRLVARGSGGGGRSLPARACKGALRRDADIADASSAHGQVAIVARRFLGSRKR